MRIDTIQEFAGAWKDDEAFHAYVNNHFAERVNAFSPLRQLRDHVEKNLHLCTVNAARLGVLENLRNEAK